jgi:hypothetical protein
MSDCEELNQTDEEILRDEVSDEALEAASVALRKLPTLMHNTYCYACPVDNPQQSFTQLRWARGIAVNIIAKLPTY